MNKLMPDAVVLGLGINGFGIVRSLANKRITIWGLHHNRYEIARYSKHISPIKISDIKKDPEKLLNELLALGSKIGRKAFLIPESDAYVSFISDNREALSEFYLFNIPEKDLMDKILGKNGNRELAVEHNVLIPKTLHMRERVDADLIANTFKFPIIIKPLDTYSTHFPGNVKNIVVDSAQDFNNLLFEHEVLFEISVVQELIVGLDGNIVVCSVYFSKDSNPLGIYTGRKIRQYPPDFGVTCFGVSEKIPEIEKISVNFLKKMKYRGLATLEYAIDLNSGKYYFLEINGRSFYHNILFTDCNINLSYIAYQDTVGLQREEIRSRQRDGLIWIDFANDVGSFWRKRKNHKIKTIDWILSILKARSFAVYDKSDIKPFLYSLYLLVELIFKKIFSTADRR